RAAGEPHMSDLFSLEGKVALVTGASRGIGKIIAQAYVRQGARVYINCRHAENSDAVARELGATARPAAADISSLAGISAVREMLEAREDHLDILVCNAGAVWNESVDTF